MRTALIKNPILLLIMLVVGMSMFGCLMVYSASSHAASQNPELLDPSYYFKRQLMWLIIALFSGSIAYVIGYRRILLNSYFLLAVVTVLLLVVLYLPPTRGIHGWIRLGPINFQPSEMAKIVMVLFFASAINRVEDRIGELSSVLALMGAAGLVCGLILIEPDIGNTLALMVSLGFMLYIAGARRRYILGMAAAGVAIICIIVFVFHYQERRITGYFVGLRNPLEAPYQVLQSLIGIGNGGILGNGWGASGQKLLFLPEPFSDFIYAVIAEEIGLVFTSLLITLYLAIFIFGCRIAERCANLEAKLVVFGLTTIVTAGAFINIGVALAVLPVTGLTLPFISYGGSSLLFNMIAIGIILSIAKDQNAPQNQEKYRLNGYDIRSRWYRRAYIPSVGRRKSAFNGIARH